MPVLKRLVPELKTETALLPGCSPNVGTIVLSSRGATLRVRVIFLIEDADPSNYLIFFTVSFIFSAGLVDCSGSTGTLFVCIKLVIWGDLYLVRVGAGL